MTPESQLALFIGKYTPEIANSFKAVRRKMRGLFPKGFELAYENYNGLAVGYGPGEKGSDPILSIVAYPRWITLFFLHGASLKDPDSLLEGKGSRVRSIRLQSPDDLDRTAIKQLISQALAPHREALAGCPPLKLIIKTIIAKHRARRPPAVPKKKRAHN